MTTSEPPETAAVQAGADIEATTTQPQPPSPEPGGQAPPRR